MLNRPARLASLLVLATLIGCDQGTTGGSSEMPPSGAPGPPKNLADKMLEHKQKMRHPATRRPGPRTGRASS
jgi:hypothetical protein